MIRPLAYVTADFSSRDEEADEAAAKYCRALYEAGYAPVCPFFAQTWFLCTDIPQEYADARNMAHEFLRRSRILVVCGKKKTRSMMEDIARRLPDVDFVDLQNMVRKMASNNEIQHDISRRYRKYYL